ncbi:MAG TPA: DUF2306 domain-containing protein [Chitinophagaceae bacterium]
MIRKVAIVLFWFAFFGYFFYRYIPNVMEYTQVFPSYAGKSWLNNRLWFALHITSGLFVYVIGIIQFTSAIRNRYLKLHRVLGKIYIACSLIAILTLAFMIPDGLCKPCKISQIILTALWFLFVVLAYYLIRQRKIEWHRRMMISSFICAAYFVTVRVVDKFAMPFFYSITKTEEQALLVSDISVWLASLTIFWSYWLIRDRWVASGISPSSI